MEKWLNDNLSELLNFPVPPDLTKYILQIQNEKDLDEYLRSLLDYSNPRHKQFIAELKRRQASQNDQIGYKKAQNREDNQPKKHKKGKNKTKEHNIVPPEHSQKKAEKTEKKKTKFVNLYSEEGHNSMTIQLKGRHKCNCEAKTHDLVNNCLTCGRIVCKQEGSGPCFFCGELVCTPQEQTILQCNNKQSDNLYNKLMDQRPNKNLESSVKHRDKLLEFDRNCAQRTQVIDDESDYYQSSNVWLSASEREKLEQREKEMMSRKYASRLSKKVTLDFTGREIIEEDNFLDEFEDDDRFLDGYETPQRIDLKDENPIICPTIEFGRPIYLEQEEWKTTNTNKSPMKFNTTNRIQDKEYLEMTDEGYCLSMHQPYASLLVAGIKIHEGRTWYTSHRGRLWIASASRLPTREEIASLENSYRIIKGEHIKFPDYPTSSLLGCVTVTNVLPQEEYRRLYPEGESDSPYVMICDDFYALPIKFPIQGKHKIYKLEPKIHQAALKALQKLMREMKK